MRSRSLNWPTLLRRLGLRKAAEGDEAELLAATVADEVQADPVAEAYVEAGANTGPFDEADSVPSDAEGSGRRMSWAGLRSMFRRQAPSDEAESVPSHEEGSGRRMSWAGLRSMFRRQAPPDDEDVAAADAMDFEGAEPSEPGVPDWARATVSDEVGDPGVEQVEPAAPDTAPSDEGERSLAEQVEAALALENQVTLVEQGDTALADEAEGAYVLVEGAEAPVEEEEDEVARRPPFWASLDWTTIKQRLRPPTITLSFEDGVMRMVVFQGRRVVAWDMAQVEEGPRLEEAEPIDADQGYVECFRSLLEAHGIRYFRLVTDIALVCLPPATPRAARHTEALPEASDQHGDGGFHSVFRGGSRPDVARTGRWGRPAGVRNRGA